MKKHPHAPSYRCHSYPVSQDCVTPIFKGTEIVILAFILVLTSHRQEQLLRAASDTPLLQGSVIPSPSSHRSKLVVRPET
jgi:hypothetical protein